MDLNREQQRAVMHRDGPMLVLAGPGSGKTAVLVNRVLHLVKDLRADPYGILVLTFSKAAAMQMEERFNRLADASYPVTFGTFHAIFYHILKSQGLYQRAEILKDYRKIELMKRACKEKGIQERNDKAFLVRLVELTGLKKMGCTELIDRFEDREKEALELVFDTYNRICRAESLIDFNDMIADCLKMLKSNDKILKKWQDRYKYILVDEFQDIDLRQYEILKLLAGTRCNVFCVGDDDQSIYSFRGAKPSVMTGFVTELGDVEKVVLKVNYRCPGNVIRHASRLIEHNETRFEKRQVSAYEDKADSNTEPCIIHRCFRSVSDQAKYLADVIDQISAENGMNNHKAGIGILYRISKIGDIIEEELKNRGMSYTRKDRSLNYYKSEWVEDVISYLRLSLGDSASDMLRILNRPYRGLSRECIKEGSLREGMLEYYRDDESRDRVVKLLGDIDFIKGMTCYGAVNYILRGIGLLDHFKSKYGSKGRMEFWEEETEDLLERGRSYKTVREWLRAIEDREDEEDVHGDNFVELGTLHGAKGLEYDNVFMTGLQEGVFPLKRCDDRESLEEERRLFYVGMTRCRKKLWLLGVKRDEYGKGESRFIKEAGLGEESNGSIKEDVI